MSDDLLQRSTRALREEGGAEPAPDQSALMRARIMSQTKRRAQLRPQGIWQWAAVVCLGFFATTAMAHVIRVQLPRVIEALREPEAAQPPAATKKAKPRAAKPVQSKAAEPVVPEAAVAPEVPPEPVPEAPSVVTEPAKPVVTAPPQRPAPTRAPRPAKAVQPPVAVQAPAPVAPPPPAALPEEEPLPTPTVMPPTAAPAKKAPAAESAELALFRRAQGLHLKHDERAIEAWDAYLRVAGKSALAPEARYNRALGLVRANRYAEAKRALAPFAEGKYGSYRRQEAQALLERLPK